MFKHVLRSAILLACVGTALPVWAATPADIIAVTKTDQSLTPGATIPLIVRVVDANIPPQPVAGVTVSFSAPGLTALGSTLVQTSADGLAQATFAVPNFQGTFYASASVSGLPTSVQFTVSVSGTVTPPPPGSGGIRIVSGNGQIALQAQPAPRSLAVSIVDLNNVPQSGAEVDWKVTRGPGPTFVGATSTWTDTTDDSIVYVTYTDTNGRASITVLGASPSAVPYLQSEITATAYGYGSVKFSLTTLGNNAGGQPAFLSTEVLAPANRQISAHAGQTLTGALQVRTTAFSVAIPNVGVELINSSLTGPSATCANGPALSDFRGLATCDLAIGRKVGDVTLGVLIGSTKTETVNLHVDPGPPAQVKIIQGDAQSGDAGQALPLALTALITDAYDNVLPGTAVQWEVVTPGTLALTPPTVLTTDTSGRTSTRVTLGRVPGTYSVRVRAGEATGLFTVTAVARYSQVRILSGNTQTALTNEIFPTPLTIQVSDDAGNPAQGVNVDFTVASGDATLFTTTATTGPDGRASTTAFAGPTAGDIVISANAGNLPPVTFTLKSRPASPVVESTGIVNAAGYQEGIVPGSLVSILGAGLAPNLEGCVSSGSTAVPLPATLAGVAVQFGKHSAPILTVCNQAGAEQVTVQAPFELAPGTVPVTIVASGGSTVVDGVPVWAAQPGIFESSAADGRFYGSVQRADGSFAGPDNPVQRGEIVRLFTTGLGPVLPRAGTNQPGRGGQAVFLPVIVGVNNAGVRVISAEYAQNMIGVYIITFEVPKDAPSGSDLPLSVAVLTAMGGSPVYSNPSRIAVE